MCTPGPSAPVAAAATATASGLLLALTCTWLLIGTRVQETRAGTWASWPDKATHKGVWIDAYDPTICGDADPFESWQLKQRAYRFPCVSYDPAPDNSSRRGHHFDERRRKRQGEDEGYEELEREEKEEREEEEEKEERGQVDDDDSDEDLPPGEGRALGGAAFTHGSFRSIATLESFNYKVATSTKNASWDKYIRCGATVIHKNLLLTSAKCLAHGQNLIRIFYTLDNGTRISAFANRWCFTMLNKNDPQFLGLGVVQLDSSFNYGGNTSIPACMVPHHSTPATTICSAYGWTKSGRGWSELTRVPMQMKSCSTIYPTPYRNLPTQDCYWAHKNDTTASTCNHDNGMGLICYDRCAQTTQEPGGIWGIFKQTINKPKYFLTGVQAFSFNLGCVEPVPIITFKPVAPLVRGEGMVVEDINKSAYTLENLLKAITDESFNYAGYKLECTKSVVKMPPEVEPPEQEFPGGLIYG